jgi:hypothetical protein
LPLNPGYGLIASLELRVLSATGKEICAPSQNGRLRCPETPRNAARITPGMRGIRWMSVIVARILLLAAYASILGGTFGWFGHVHAAMH